MERGLETTDDSTIGLGSVRQVLGEDFDILDGDHGGRGRKVHRGENQEEGGEHKSKGGNR